MKHIIMASGAALAAGMLAGCGSGNDPACPAVMAGVSAAAPANYHLALAEIQAISDAVPPAGFSAQLRPLVTSVALAVTNIGRDDIRIGRASSDQLASYYAARRKLAAYCG